MRENETRTYGLVLYFKDITILRQLVHSLPQINIARIQQSSFIEIEFR